MNFSVPLALPTARGGVQPKLDLSYTSAGGFGIAGDGWNIGASAISRQTDRGLPRYGDQSDWQPEQDRFLFGAMELVPICTVTGTTCAGAPGELMPPWASGWQHFRARIEGGFLRFFWSPDHRTWRAYGKDGASFEFGVPLDGSGYHDALQVNPDRQDEIYRWHLVRQYDGEGGVHSQAAPQPVNVIVYRYEQVGGDVYLTDIYDTPPAADPHTQNLLLYAHHTALAYDVRPDSVISYRSGWLTEHGLRLAHVDVTSKPFVPSGGTAQPRQLVRRYWLGYDHTSHASLLTSVQMEGRCSTTVSEGADGLLAPTSCPRMPAVRLEYQHSLGSTAAPIDHQGRQFEAFDEQIKAMDGSPPHSLDEALVGLVDVNSDGLPDVLATSPGVYGNGFGVFSNGAGGAKRFGPATHLNVTAAGGIDASALKLSSPNVSVLDFDADGRVDFVHMAEKKSYSVFSFGPNGLTGREIPTASAQDVKIDFSRDARNVQAMDVNGDGLVDFVFSSPTEYQTFFSLGRYPGGDGQFGHATMTSAGTADISNEPVRFCAPWSSAVVRFSDPDTRVADMNGDGLADIVRLRAGQIVYWPGRGNGFWGTGKRDDCAAGSFATDRHIEMQDAPQFGVVDAGTLLLSDVNADGFSDLVEVRNDAVDVYLNDGGTGWTARHIIENTPIRPPGSNYVRLTDIDGSGSPDILWGRAYEYKYIDLTGGVIPHLLVKVQNGLGGTTEFQYETSIDVMREADAAGTPWTDRAPTTTPVIVQSTVRDNLERIGRPGGTYITQYKYRDAVFEGRQREFRGFREAQVKVLGDANSPTSTSRTVFELGECKLGLQGEADACSPSARWKDNWREALKGLPLVTETFDERGIYLTTQHSGYELRQLYTGRDGRRVMASMPVTKESLVYDTDPAVFDHVETPESLTDVVVHFKGGTAPDPSPSAQGFSKRAQAGTARVRSRSTFDDFGNMLTSVKEGCVAGCPNGVDEAITATSVFALPPGDVSGWAFREVQSYITGSVNTGRRQEVTHGYNAEGKLLQTSATLSGTLALNRFQTPSGPAVAPSPPNASGGVSTPTQIVLRQNTYDSFGRVVSVKGPNGGCASSDSDADYAQIPIASRTYVGPIGSGGCGSQVLTSAVTDYDRGLEVAIQAVNAQGQPSRSEVDGFGRVTRLFGPNTVSPGTLALQPMLTASYTLPSDPLVSPYSIVVVLSQDGTDVNSGSYHQSWSFTDGLGRTLATLSQTGGQAEGEPGDWVVGGAVLYNSKGGVMSQYLPWFITGSPATFSLSAPPPSNFTSGESDAFGRRISAYGLDHLISGSTKYHALSQDVYDAADLQGPRANTYTTVVADGQGRGVENIYRIRAGSNIEQRLVLNDYLPTGELRRVIQRRAGSSDVVRWFRYDSLGRMVLNVEPNTSVGFDPDPNAPLTNIKALTYAYDDAGDLVGTADARGCGVNYYYDAGGRILAEDRSPCLPTQPAYSAPNLTTGDGTEAFYRYDTPDPESTSVVDAAGQALNASSSFVLGRVASVSGLGSKTIPSYDARGRAIGVGTRLVKPGVPGATLASRYAPRWYVKTMALDALGRTNSASTGVAVPQLFGTDGQSRITFSHSKRGAVTAISGSYGSLLSGVTYTSEGLVDTVTLGDAAATRRAYNYDVKRRVSAVETFRAAAPFWTNPPQGSPYTAAPAATSQLELEHYGFSYDDQPGAPVYGPGNLWQIRDYRSDLDWPASAKPVTREFQYDDLNRMTQAKYTPASGAASDPWTSPYAAENADSTRKPQPSPHTSFANRVLEQDFSYDWLGNIQTTSDNENGFWDRSLGAVTVGTASNHPHQVVAASNRATAPSSTRKGDLSAAFDVSGNYTDLTVRRDGSCLPSGGSCWQRFKYDWDEVGQLVRARRWDLATAERTANDAPTEPVPPRAADADLRFTYDASGARTVKTAVDGAGVQVHTVYIFGGLELRGTQWNTAASPNDYDQSADKVQLRLPAGIATARVLYATQSLPTLTSGQQHVFLELADQIGSSTFVIDKGTGELVEAATYQAYGAPESDYRPGRWGGFREPYRFSGKEDDIEVGLQYFGARYYSPNLGVWMSPDPVNIHRAGSDVNPYAYVHGSPAMLTDPDGRDIDLATIVTAGIVIGISIMCPAAAPFLLAAESVVLQSAQTGSFSNVQWGLNGVAGAVLAGVVAGGVGAAIAQPGASVGTSLLAGAASGATGGAASYLAAAVVSPEGASWAGFAKTVAIGGASGLAGAGGAIAGGSGSLGAFGAAIGGVAAGTAAGADVQLMLGEHVDGKTLLLSAGIGLAQGLARAASLPSDTSSRAKADVAELGKGNPHDNVYCGPGGPACGDLDPTARASRLTPAERFSDAYAKGFLDRQSPDPGGLTIGDASQEWGTVLTQKAGAPEVTANPIVTQDNGQTVKMDVPKGAVAIVHSHPPDMSGLSAFSVLDINTSFRLTTNIYMAQMTRLGPVVLVYEPSRNVISRIR